MLHGHAVGIARKAQRQQRHVQQSVAEASQLFQARRPIAAQNADRLLGREAVVPGRHRRVRGEHALAPHLLDVGLGGPVLRPAAQLAFEQRQRQQRRVAFVHVVHVYAQAQRMGHAHAAHAQHDLLLQPVIRVAAVEVVGQSAVPSRIFVEVGVEQINRHHVAGLPAHVIAPRAHRHHAVFHLDRDPRRLFRAKVRRVPGLHFLALHARRAQMLLEIPFAMHQGKRRQRHAQVGRRAQRVSGQHAQAA